MIHTFSVFHVQSDIVNTMAGLAEGTYPPFNDTRLCRPLKSCSTVHTGWLMMFNLGFFHIGNDPSAGSPTETLLRLLLPLNDQV